MSIIVLFILLLLAGGAFLFTKGMRELGPFCIGSGVILSIVLFGTSICSYMNHVKDLGIIRGQEAVIKVHKERIERLDQRLAKFTFPKNSVVSLNADSPVSSIVKSLTEAEESVAMAEQVRAKSVVNIAQRKVGPFSVFVERMGEK